MSMSFFWESIRQLLEWYGGDLEKPVVLDCHCYKPPLIKKRDSTLNLIKVFFVNQGRTSPTSHFASTGGGENLRYQTLRQELASGKSYGSNRILWGTWSMLWTSTSLSYIPLWPVGIIH